MWVVGVAYIVVCPSAVLDAGSGSFIIVNRFLDTGAGVDTGRHRGSATEIVSFFIKGIVVAFPIAWFLQIEGDSIGADGWRPLSTNGRVIPLHVVPPSKPLLPLETGGNGAIGGTAAPFVVAVGKSLFPAGALGFFIGADIATLPIVIPTSPLTPIHPSTIVREEEKEEEEQQSAHF